MKRILNLWPTLVVLSTVFFLFLANYEANTWLTGWDNLHPEFDFKTNIIDRSIYGVWQQYQGLGVLSGNAHSADIIRQIFLWLTSFIVPTSLIRYFYHFLSLFIGAIGIYFLTNYLFKSEKYRKVAATSSALVYILNLGTIQYFYVPYESFSHFYASFPWLVFGVTKLFSNWTKKHLAIFTLISLLAIPSFYIPTIFVVYMITLLIFGISAIFSHEAPNLNLFSHIKRPLLVILITLMINAFWLFPFVYFLTQGTTSYSNSKINLMFTEEAFLRNQLFGNISDTLLFKSFLFDTTDFSKNMQTHQYMLEPWINHLKQPLIMSLIYGLFSISFLGTIFAINRKLKFAKTFLGLELIALFALINNNPPTGFIYSFLQDSLPIFKQIFRFPFTKFIVPMILFYSIFFGFGILLISKLLARIHRSTIYLILPLLASLLFFVYQPSFQGNFIYSSLRVQIPQEYFSLMQFMQTEPNGRIANLPQPTFWGWTSYKWGYRGSGFPWYGIKQPILDRAFDVWSPYNEQYYQELNSILTTGKYSDFDKLLQKYNINYVWLDSSVIIPENRDPLQLTKLQNYLQTNPNYQLIFSEGNQRIYIYQNSSPSDISAEPAENYRLSPFNTPSLPVVTLSSSQVSFENSSPSSGFLNIPSLEKTEDASLLSVFYSNNQVQIYQLQPEIKIDSRLIPYPETLTTITLPLAGNQPFTLQINDQTIDPPAGGPNQVIIGQSINTLKVYASSSIPAYQTTFKLSPVASRNIPIQQNQKIIISYPILSKSNFTLDPSSFQKPATNCLELEDGRFEKNINLDQKYVEYLAFQASSCDYFEISNMPLSGLLTHIESQNISGRPLKVSFKQTPPGNYLTETILTKNNNLIVTPYFNLPDSHLYLEIDNYAVGNETRTNRLGQVQIYPFPLQNLQQTSIVPTTNLTTEPETPLDYESTTYKYTAPLTAANNQIITLNQAKNLGWQAFVIPQSANLFQRSFPFLFYKPLPKLASDWNNQWLVTSTTNQSLIILFWPQYLAINGVIITALALLYFGLNLHPIKK